VIEAGQESSGFCRAWLILPLAIPKSRANDGNHK
jgi:hypothetical protein